MPNVQLSSVSKAVGSMNLQSKLTRTPNTGRTPKSQPTIFRMDVEGLIASRDPSLPLAAPKTRNVVIFGDSGVGKSSLINMLAGRKIANTSSGVLGCTFQSYPYEITIEGVEFNIWDTAGLDEGTRGRVTPEVAEKNLVDLIRGLRNANGIHLLVYCIRGPSVRKSLTRNYTIFYSMICRKKVPIVAVVTGLENEPISMDDWWTVGQKELAKYKMRFDAHACVTTLPIEKAGGVFEDRVILSQQMAQKLIIDNCHRVAVRLSSKSDLLIKAALHDFRLMMKFGWENMGPTSTVIFYQTDVLLFHAGVFGDLKRITSQINGRSFAFQHVGDLSGRYIVPKVSKGGADLLIFTGKMSKPNLRDFRDFYTACNGEVCPLLVVTDYDSVAQWESYLNEQGIGGRVESFSSPSTDGRSSGPADLSGVIDELCLVRGPTQNAREKILRFLRRGSKEDAGDNS